MFDALICDKVLERPGGVRARAGSFVLAVDCPERDRQALLGADAPVVLWCALEMRDEEMLLAGFASEERRDLYRALRAIPNIGRRSALAALDCGERGDILRAVAGADKSFFRAVPGLGPKRIEAVISTLARTYDADLPKPVEVPVQWLVEAREALAGALGGDADEAELRVLGVLRQGRPRSAEELTRRALEEAR